MTVNNSGGARRWSGGVSAEISLMYFTPLTVTYSWLPFWLHILIIFGKNLNKQPYKLFFQILYLTIMKSGFVVCLTCCCTKNCCDVGSSLKSKQVKLLNQQHFQWTLVQWNSPNSATCGQKFSLKRINNETEIMKLRYFFWTWLQFCYNAKTGPTDPIVGRWRSGLKPPKTSFKNQMSSFPVSHPHLSRFSLVTSCLFSPGLRVQHVLFSSSSSEWHVDLFKRHILNVPLRVWPKNECLICDSLQLGEAATGAGVPLHRGAGRAAVVQHGRHRQPQRQAWQVSHPQEHRGPNPADQTAWAGSVRDARHVCTNI